MSIKNYSDIKCLVKNEIESIKKRDGELPPTAYVVTEVASRLKTLSPWDGYDRKKPLCQNLRAVVEELVKGKLNIRGMKSEDMDMDVIYISPNPYEALEDSLGSKVNVGRSVDNLPATMSKRAKLKKKLRKAS
jgi:hypothetical protein